MLQLLLANFSDLNDTPKEQKLSSVSQLLKAIDLFTDTAAILNSIVSDSYYGMLRGQISMYLLPEYPIIAIWNNGFKMGTVSVKRSISIQHNVLC